MRCLLFFLNFLSPCFGYSQQQEGKVWVQTGIKSQLNNNWGWSVDLTNRLGEDLLETFFSQISIKYKLLHWLRPSFDYRIILDKDKFGNYIFSNRLNLNADLKETYERWTLGLRFRYQYSFVGTSKTSYDAEFDPAIRFKPQISYDIKKSVFSPICSVEFFYNPSNGQQGHQFTKCRIFVGTRLDISGPNDIALGYIIDKELFAIRPDTKHILSVSYTYDLQAIKRANKKEMNSVGRDLFNE